MRGKAEPRQRRQTGLKVKSAEFVRSAFRQGDFVRNTCPEVAFAGRSNVGKSALMNRLLGRKGLARTSSAPGRTRCVNYFLINGRFYFVDLPGYGYASVGHRQRKGWARLVDQYLRQVGERVRVVLLVDAKVGATPLDLQALDYLSSLDVGVLVVATKIDKVSRGQRTRHLAEIREVLKLDEPARLVAVSARSGEGVRELWSEIDQHLLPKSTA